MPCLANDGQCFERERGQFLVCPQETPLQTSCTRTNQGSYSPMQLEGRFPGPVHLWYTPPNPSLCLQVSSNGTYTSPCLNGTFADTTIDASTFQN